MLKRTFLLTAAFLFVIALCWPLSAQEKKPKEKPELDSRSKQRIERQMKELIAEVKLTDEQKVKIRTIYEKDALSGGSRMDRSRWQEMSRDQRMAMMQKSREQREKINKEIEKLLTKDQVKKFKAYLEKQRSRRGRRRTERGD